ncbi:MAG TPA: ferritin, partial [candidate division Zixibacteria bacterium]|nr:ferritin [candidate division Zixibacteria bacterium]
MMITKKMAKALNEQIGAELDSEYIYLAMAYKFEEMNLTVFAKWFYKQAEEEHKHALKFAKYLVEQGAPVTVPGIEAPKAAWKSAQEICDAAVEHEEYITKRIHDLVKLARAEGDIATE